MIDNKVTISLLGGIEAIFNAMSFHTESAAVQKTAGGSLGNLAIENGIPFENNIFLCNSGLITFLRLVGVFSFLSCVFLFCWLLLILCPLLS